MKSPYSSEPGQGFEASPSVRCIYVGGWRACGSFRADLGYGMTGRAIQDEALFVSFNPDGCPNQWWDFSRDQIYIPSTDGTRHCPKP